MKTLSWKGRRTLVTPRESTTVTDVRRGTSGSSHSRRVRGRRGREPTEDTEEVGPVDSDGRGDCSRSPPFPDSHPDGPPLVTEVGVIEQNPHELSEDSPPPGL